MPKPVTLGELQSGARERLYGRMARARLVLVLVLGAVAAGVSWLDPAPWRRWWLGATFIVAVLFSVIEMARYLRRGVTPRTVPVNLSVGIAVQGAMLVGTGGILSPLLPFVLPVSLVNGVHVGGVTMFLALGAQLAIIWSLAVGEALGWLGGLQLAALAVDHPPALPWTIAAVISFLCVVATRIGVELREAFDGMLRAGLRQRDELLETYSAHGRELEALSGEIAHELKNPLATIKGLSQLLARDPAVASQAQRVSVLSREIERMQGIIDDLLNFSRPLVPLHQAPVDLTALCGEIVVLHEGLAQGRGVLLRLGAAEPVGVACDSRKVKQILMNLIHNAIEASPRGATVELELDARQAESVRVTVLDRGPGLPAELGERIFEPGVTSKASGSGLGLTIARALSRQHGGELRLRDRAGGGAVAEITLPRHGPSTHPPETTAEPAVTESDHVPAH